MPPERNASSRIVSIDVGPVALDGDLAVPSEALGVILFAHGSGSSRFSPRNRFVAGTLIDAGFATLLLDLLSPAEEVEDEVTGQHRFDIPLLGDRLVAAIDWLAGDASTARLRVGLFGASTGAGGALVAAAQRPQRVAAVVSRGGRPDLAAESLPAVRAPTLLIVGGNDDVVIALNQRARAAMQTEVRIEIVPGATHLFEEPGTLEQVADLAREWFAVHLAAPDTPDTRGV
jgi:putative phosphoribosyl transferase